MSSVVDLFACNLQALMETNPTLDSQYKLGVAASLSPTNVGRYKRADVAAQIDSVEKIAKVFGLRACDMLDPDLRKRLAAGEPLRMGEPQPPLMPESDWKALSPRTRAFVEDLCACALAGEVQDTDVAWLHDSMQRAKKPREN